MRDQILVDFEQFCTVVSLPRVYTSRPYSGYPRESRSAGENPARRPHGWPDSTQICRRTKPLGASEPPESNPTNMLLIAFEPQRDYIGGGMDRPWCENDQARPR